MHQYEVSITPSGRLEGLTRALSHYMNFNSGVRCERRQNVRGRPESSTDVVEARTMDCAACSA